MLRKTLALLLCLSFMIILPSAMTKAFADDVTYIESSESFAAEPVTNEAVAASVAYEGPYVTVGNATLPMAEHMPGTYFTKDGGPCSCHYSVDCVANPQNCNCMRYYPTGDPATCEIDLLSVQCFGFSRLVFYKCFGFIDQPINADLYYSAGSLSSSQVNSTSVKNLLMKAAPGAHVRLAMGHSVSILYMDDSTIKIYHGNANGDDVSVTAETCVVSVKTYTWAEFAYYARAGILYVNMPYDYPGSDVTVSEKKSGYYKITSGDGLRLRSEPSTQSESLAVIPHNTIVEVTEISGFWGKTTYDGKTGWIFLEYAAYYSASAIEPVGGTFVRGTDGYLRGILWKVDYDDFMEHFNNTSLSVTGPDGSDLTKGGYIPTGSTVSLMVDGNVIDSLTVCLAGDANCNGMLDVGDYLITRRAYFGTYNFTPAAKAAADVNGSGDIDSRDYILIKRFFFSWNTSFFADFL